MDVGWWVVIDLVHCLALQDLLGRSGSPNSVVQQDKGLGVLCHVLHVVRRAEEGQSPRALEIADLAIEAGPGCRIQTGGGLVENQ